MVDVLNAFNCLNGILYIFAFNRCLSLGIFSLISIVVFIISTALNLGENETPFMQSMGAQSYHYHQHCRDLDCMSDTMTRNRGRQLPVASLGSRCQTVLPTHISLTKRTSFPEGNICSS